MSSDVPLFTVYMATKVLPILLLVASQVHGFRYPEVNSAPQQQQVKAFQGPGPSEKFPYQEQLSEDYMLYWDFNTTHITFEVIVRTNGWVGFGISPNGAMKSSDIVIGWVKDGQAYFADRHAEGHFLPSKDTSQDWTLVKAQEVGQYTILKVGRQLETCDAEGDLPILPGTTRVIFAYSRSDPTTDDAISYHGTTRGTKSVLLLDPPASDQQDSALPSDVKVLELKSGNVSVPSSDTTYWCTFWKLPDLGGKHHMIRYEPIIQPGSENLLHHLVLHYCTGTAGDSDYFPSSFNCYQNVPSAARNCRSSALLGWAVGGKTFNYPKDVGYPFGGARDPTYFMLETHYDNPYRRSDLVDDSGLRLYLTEELRPNEAGSIMVGVRVNSYHIIPPYQKSFLNQGFCGEDCLAEALDNQEIHVFANLLHSHLIGSKMRLRHFRDDAELPPIQEDNNYDFDYQETRPLSPHRTIKKGDSILMECEYDSTGRTGVTYGGLSTREEMCLSFVMYYPRIDLTVCESSIDYEIPPRFKGRSVFDIVENAKWSKPYCRAHQLFQRAVLDSPQTQVCYGDGSGYKSNFKRVSKPRVTGAYKREDTCSTSD
ncbi:hypothetical protein RRG08_037936 [Elysia crispata]|uniref:DOMON domain-containing protein n=1 Tax=Elysia crispata TaxID=231223 RepID=A0AAE1D9H6_9GAST|nr:hypothetical protein RRG08_037936 [Elysia crispata]